MYPIGLKCWPIIKMIGNRKKTVPYYKLVPLVDILSEILQVGPGSKKVAACYEKALMTLGSEFSILKDLHSKQLDTSGIPFLSAKRSRVCERVRFTYPAGMTANSVLLKYSVRMTRAKLSGQPLLFQGAQNKCNIKNKISAATDFAGDTAIPKTPGQ